MHFVIYAILKISSDYFLHRFLQNAVSSEKNETKCLCGKKENMRHIYSCKYLNCEEPGETYEKLFSENLKIQN